MTLATSNVFRGVAEPLISTGPFFARFPKHLNLTVSPTDLSVIDGVVIVPTGTDADEVVAFVNADEFPRDVQTSYAAVVADAVSKKVNKDLVAEGAATAAAVALTAAQAMVEVLESFIGNDLNSAISTLEAANLDAFAADADQADPEAITADLEEIVNDKLVAEATATAVEAVLVASNNVLNRVSAIATPDSELTKAIAALEMAETDDLATLTGLSQDAWTAAEAEADKWGFDPSAYDAIRYAEKALEQAAAMAVSTSDTGNEDTAIRQAEAVLVASTDVDKIAVAPPGITDTAALAAGLSVMRGLIGTSQTLLLLQSGPLTTAKLLKMAQAAKNDMGTMIEDWGIGASSSSDGTDVPALYSTMQLAIETVLLMEAQASDDGNEAAVIETVEDLFSLDVDVLQALGVTFEADFLESLQARIEGLKTATEESTEMLAKSLNKITLGKGSEAIVDSELVEVSPSPPTPELNGGTPFRADDLTEEEQEDLGWISAVVLLLLLFIFCPFSCYLYARLYHPGNVACWFKLKTTHSNMKVPIFYMNAETREALRKHLRAASDKKQALMAKDEDIDASVHPVDLADVEVEGGM